MSNTTSELELLRQRNAELEERVQKAEKYADEAKRVFSGNLDELKRAGEKAQELLSSMAAEMTKADALRNRLFKTTDALARADAYILALRTKSDTVEERAKEYDESKIFLSTPDDVQTAPQR